MRKRAQGLRLGGLGGRRSTHREPPSATTGSSQPLLLDNVGASGAARGRDERLWEDGPTRIESTGSTVSHGLPGARASTAALAHRQHLRADELMVLTLEALTTTGGTTTCHGAHRTSGEAGLSLGRQRSRSGWRARLVRVPVPQRAIGTMRGGFSNHHGFCKARLLRSSPMWGGRGNSERVRSARSATRRGENRNDVFDSSDILISLHNESVTLLTIPHAFIEM